MAHHEGLTEAEGKKIISILRDFQRRPIGPNNLDLFDRTQMAIAELAYTADSSTNWLNGSDVVEVCGNARTPNEVSVAIRPFVLKC